MDNQKKHKTWWDQESGVIRLQVFGDYSQQDANESVNGIAEIKQQQQDKRLKFLIDLSAATKPSAEARKIIVEKIYKDPDLEKIAVIVPSVIVRTINSFMVKAAGLSDEKIRMFEAETEALQWLKQ